VIAGEKIINITKWQIIVTRGVARKALMAAKEVGALGNMAARKDARAASSDSKGDCQRWKMFGLLGRLLKWQIIGARAQSWAKLL
jgi:hypothetical protein